MRKVTVIISDHSRDSLVRLEAEVDALLAKHPTAKLTWLQSSASSTRQGPTKSSDIIVAQHVLTCAVEWEEAVPKQRGK